jgi:hypothetical protein
MAKPSSKAATILRFPSTAIDDDEEVPVGLPPVRAAAVSGSQSVTSVDLGDMARVWLLIGSGNRGKTSLAKWLAEQVANRGVEAIAAAADPQKRSLMHYLDGVYQPETNDAASTTRWLERLLRHCMATRSSAYVDLGGGDTSLGRLLDRMPDLVTQMEAAGVTPVAVHVIGPRIDDLSYLGAFEQRGFQPHATAIIRNEGVVTDPTMTREEAFAHVHRHSAYKAAVARGAVPLWMPRMDPAVMAKLESKLLNFTAARDGIMPEGRQVVPLDTWDRSTVAHWLQGMSEAMAPIMGWLPR